MSPRTRLILLAAAAGGAFAVIALGGGVSSDAIRDRVEDTGAWGPIVFVVLCSLLVCCFFPNPVLAGASGLLFGTAIGFPLTLAFVVLGASLAFSIARWWAHDAVEQIAGARVRAVRRWVGRRGFLAVFGLRVAPGVPYTVVNYLAGLTPVRLPTFAAATAVGGAPRAFAYTALGGSLDDLTSPEALAAFGVLGVMAVIGLAVAARDPDLRAAARSLRPRGGSGPGTGSSSPDDRSEAPR